MPTKPTRTSHISFYLKPSKKHGVGVFIRHSIQKGTLLHLFDKSEKLVYRNPNHAHKAFFVHRFGVSAGNGMHSTPAKFSRMSIGWYLNHSKRPNVFHKNYVFYAKKNILEEEELTIDYATLE
jgi:SET domain-containing protein